MASISPYIPQYITVHLGPPDSNAANVTVPFVDYIKNVASSEIYPTWDEAAIRANVLAQISFALNRVYTEYYPSRGYNFNITNSTATDQKYIHGRNVFENVSRIVDEIFNSYVRRQGSFEPLPAAFCNGTTVTCSGLSQWGSQALAQQGLSEVDILRRYYGDDIEIVNNAPVRGILRSYPGTPLRRGDRGQAVEQIQVSLNRIARNYPAIPRVTSDGVFGEATEESVRTFQRIFGLTPDGVVGNATWYALVRLYVAVTRLAELSGEGQTIYDPDYVLPATVSEGDSGEVVSTIQYRLSLLQRFVDYLPQVRIDGIFGPATRSAVEAFQRLVGLPQTGEVNRATWDALANAWRGAEAAVERSGVRDAVPAIAIQGGTVPMPDMPRFPVDPPALPLRVILQREQALPPLHRKIFDAAIDALAAVMAVPQDPVRWLQRAAALPETGVVDRATWDVLSRLYPAVLGDGT